MSRPPLELWLVWAGLIVLLIVARAIIPVGQARHWWHCWHYLDGHGEGPFKSQKRGCLAGPERHDAYRQRCCRCSQIRLKVLAV